MEIGTLIRELGGGMWISAEIFILTLLFSLPLGLVVAFGRMSKIAPVRWISKLYISIMRGTPLMLQLMVVYFGPYYLFGMRISTGYRMTAVLIGFAINYAAYFAEIYRGGIEAIPVGQYEAAKVLGYSKGQTFFRIVFPQVCNHILPAVTKSQIFFKITLMQMIKRIVPPMSNEIITLVKDTSLAFVLAVTEMFTMAKQIAAAQTSMVPYIAAGIFYYVFNLLVAMIMEKIEEKLNYYHYKIDHESA